MIDPIADMLNRIRNAQAVKHQTVEISFSNLKYKIAKILEGQGFIKKADRKGRAKKRVIEIALKYDQGKAVISGLKKISKPGQRVYKTFKELKPIKSGYGIAIISTSKGLMINKQASKRRIGGEVICEIW